MDILNANHSPLRTECNETLYWLSLMKDTGYITEEGHASIEKDCKEILAILISSIKTTKNNNIIK